MVKNRVYNFALQNNVFITAAGYTEKITCAVNTVKKTIPLFN